MGVREGQSRAKGRFLHFNMGLLPGPGDRVHTCPLASSCCVHSVLFTFSSRPRTLPFCLQVVTSTRGIYQDFAGLKSGISGLATTHTLSSRLAANQP
ncbi:unnamed protein product [Protopolystoma xenopodis]|uniref:Uncharacterized protein n=1 Tax=Protopolystoma xenopodis TaxID=117903 RepID=A0A448WC57_9PLAT|nr:unnamed protein product [Protopolystoma xenopodis]